MYTCIHVTPISKKISFLLLLDKRWCGGDVIKPGKVNSITFDANYRPSSKGHAGLKTFSYHGLNFSDDARFRESSHTESGNVYTS